MKIVMDSYEKYIVEKIFGFSLKEGKNTTETIKVKTEAYQTVVEIDSDLLGRVVNIFEPIATYAVAAAKAFMAMYAKGFAEFEQLVLENNKFKKEGAIDDKEKE